MAIKIEAAARLQAAYQKLATHKGRVLMLGFGGVGQTMLPILLRHIDLSPYKITVVELHDHEELFQSKYGTTGIEYTVLGVTRTNMDEVLSSYVGAGDLIINLALNIDGIEIVSWCLDHDVMYIDTSIERWPEAEGRHSPVPAAGSRGDPCG